MKRRRPRASDGAAISTGKEGVRAAWWFDATGVAGSHSGTPQVILSEKDEPVIEAFNKDIGMKIIGKCDDLPLAVKVCFLYFYLIPKNILLGRDMIIYMWISEGLVHHSTKELEELGRDYYNELIVRNLLEAETDYVDQWHCTMHDVVCSYAHYVARDEALVEHNRQIDISKLHSQKFFRLSIETDELEWNFLEDQKLLRN
uniref:Disease resistance protein winged helix domain-containing protein n=1 Tax=Oryza glumipatula TaxID=40148 RepID=A0A0E0BJ18_9ORYZ